jgi:hypothetical protein
MDFPKIFSTRNPCDTPLNSLKDSNASLKMETTEERIRVCSLACNTLGVRGATGVSGWGLGQMTLFMWTCTNQTTS